MNSKQLIKFYFCADNLNVAFDKMILREAFGAGGCPGSGEDYAERICDAIFHKQRLGELWTCLDGAMATLTAKEKEILRFYGDLRCGIYNMDAQLAKEIRRVVAKFRRRLRCARSFAEGEQLLKQYFCLL